ncbi:MAG: hypothetical protein AAF206_14930, partial [Bacteroidota bacterium]
TVSFSMELLRKLEAIHKPTFIFAGQSPYLENGIQIFIYQRDNGIIGMSHFSCFNVPRSECKECYPLRSLGLYPLEIGFLISKCQDVLEVSELLLPSCL